MVRIILQQFILNGRNNMRQMWLARDKNNELFLFVGTEKLIKEDKQWVSINADYVELDNNLFPEVQWLDEEPIKVKLVIEK